MTRHKAASRRNVLGAGASLLVLAAAAAGEAKARELDGDLLDLCATFHTIHAEQDRQAVLDDNSFPSEAYEALSDRWWATMQAINATPARTPEGLAAKAGMIRTALRNLEEVDNPAMMDPDTEMTLSLLADILGPTQKERRA